MEANMKVTIRQTINEANIGDGWTDTHAVANCFAEYCEAQYKRAAREAAPEGEELEFDIDITVARNVSGPGSFSVDCDDARIVSSIEHAHGVAWQYWADSAEARALAEYDN